MILLLNSCNRNRYPESENGIIKLEFWHGIESPENQTVLKQKIKEFEKENPKIKINAQNYGAADQVNGKIMTALAGHTEPDLFWWGNQETGQLASLGKLVKIQNFINKDSTFNKNNIIKAIWNTCKYQDTIFAVPFDANNLALYYNKDIFKSENISPDSLNTWNDLLKISIKLTKDFNHDGNIDQYGFQVPIGTNEWTIWTWQTFLWQAGGNYLSSNYKKAAFNSQAGIDAVNFWLDLVYKYKCANFSEPGAGYKTDDFIAGRTAMMINGVWNFKVLKEAHKENKLNYGALFLPQKIKRATNIGGENLYIFKSIPQREKAAWKFAKFIMSDEFQVDFAIQTGYLPVTYSATNSKKYQDFINKNEFVKTYAEQMKYGKTRPPVAHYNRISKELGRKLELALYKKISPKKALNEAAKYANEQLTREIKH